MSTKNSPAKSAAAASAKSEELAGMQTQEADKSPVKSPMRPDADKENAAREGSNKAEAAREADGRGSKSPNVGQKSPQKTSPLKANSSQPAASAFLMRVPEADRYSYPASGSSDYSAPGRTSPRDDRSYANRLTGLRAPMSIPDESWEGDTSSRSHSPHSQTTGTVSFEEVEDAAAELEMLELLVKRAEQRKKLRLLQKQHHDSKASSSSGSESSRSSTNRPLTYKPKVMSSQAVNPVHKPNIDESAAVEAPQASALARPKCEPALAPPGLTKATPAVPNTRTVKAQIEHRPPKVNQVSPAQPRLDTPQLSHPQRERSQGRSDEQREAIALAKHSQEALQKVVESRKAQPTRSAESKVLDPHEALMGDEDIKPHPSQLDQEPELSTEQLALEQLARAKVRRDLPVDDPTQKVQAEDVEREARDLRLRLEATERQEARMLKHELMPETPSTTGACAHEENRAQVQAYHSSPVTNWAGIGREADAKPVLDIMNPTYVTRRSEDLENSQKSVESKLRRNRALSNAHEVNPHVPEWNELKAAKGKADQLIDKAKTFATLMEERRVRLSLLVSALQREQNSFGTDTGINDAVDRLNRILASAENIENELVAFRKKLETRKWEEDERRMQLEGRLLVPPMGEGTYEAYERTLSKMEKVHNKNKNTIREWFKRFFMLIKPMELSEDAIKRHLLLNLQEEPAAFFLANVMRPIQEIVDRMLNMYDKSYRRPHEVIDDLRKAKRGSDEDLVYFMSDLEFKLQKIKYSFTDGLYESHRNQILRDKLMESVGEHTLREVNRRLMDAEDNQERLDITELYQDAARIERYADDWSKKPTRKSRVNQARPTVPLPDSPNNSDPEPDDPELVVVPINHVRASSSRGRSRDRRRSSSQRRSDDPSPYRGEYHSSRQWDSPKPTRQRTPSEIKEAQDHYMMCFLNMAVEDGIKASRRETDIQANDRDDVESHQRKHRDAMPKDDPEYCMTREDAAEFWEDIPKEVAAFELQIEREERQAAERNRLNRGMSKTKWRRNSEQRNYERKRPSTAWQYRQDRENAIRTPGRAIPSYPSYFPQKSTQTDPTCLPSSDSRIRDDRRQNRSPRSQHVAQITQESSGASPHAGSQEHAVNRQSSTRPNTTHGSKQVLCTKCGWTGANDRRNVTSPPLRYEYSLSGELMVYPEPGVTIETGHSTEECPRYQRKSTYPCKDCTRAGRTAFHFPDRCLEVKNHHPQGGQRESPRAFLARPTELYGLQERSEEEDETYSKN